MPVKAEPLLKDYRAKRDFSKTREPSGASARKGDKAPAGLFVVQQHAATRLHWDFRLELDGVLKSWAVTKGPSDNPKDKRLAVRVEDHPFDYATFEGTIPEGQYGGGTVMLWDEGTWEPVGDPHKGLADGDLKFRLNGSRMKGEWVLVHMKGRDSGKRENWLLIKHHDEYATDDEKTLVEKHTTSVETGRNLDDIAKGLKSRKTAAKPKVWTHGKAVALPAFRPPQLATLVDEVPQGSNWLFEMKYDGYRCLAAIAGEEVRLYTRNGNDWTTQFGTMREPLSRLTPGSALLDGEICAFNDQGRTDFSALKDALSDGSPLVYFVFDLLEQDGESLEDLPLVERKQHLAKLLGKVRKDAPIQFSEHVQGNGEKVFKALCESGYEGTIAKQAGEPYRSDRSRSWLKIKCLQRQEFVIGGWRPSTKRNRFASLLLGTWEDGKLIYRGRVGTGFNEKNGAALQKLLDARARQTPAFDSVPRDIARVANWVEPDLLGEVAFTEVTPDNVLRHPSFVGLREDKPARSVSLEKPVAPPKPAKSAPPAARIQMDWHHGAEVAEREGVHLTSPERVAYPEQGITKGELVAYYDAVIGAMLPYTADRPLSLVRCPQGRSKYCFFQKHDSGGFPEQVKKVPITEKDGSKEDYLYVDDLAGIIAAVQMNALEFHIWGARRDRIEQPERIIFDIDPDEGLDFDMVRQAALFMRDGLADLGLQTFPMVTGGKGIHVIAPLKRQAEWPDVKAFCKGFAQQLSDAEPERFVATMAKVKRKGRMFIDYLRNERGSTAIAPYSTRSRDGAPVATPVTWEEIETIAGANVFSLAEAAARASGPDPWKGYETARKPITKAMLKKVGAV
ncbi:MAG TPA: DNA ligase D [Devosiaceae bacterium]|jgi:bifunctional non-homologous end joining protein LigD